MVFTVWERWDKRNKEAEYPLQSTLNLVGIYPTLDEANFIKEHAINRVNLEYAQAKRLGNKAYRRKVVVKKTEAKPTSTKVGSYLSYQAAMKQAYK